MATAQLLTLTHGVDDKVTRIDDEIKGVDGKVTRVDDEVKCVGGKVNDIGDTVRVVLEGAQCVMFAYVSLYAARWKRNQRNLTTYGKQRQ